jgi:hypothetical protein
VDYILAIGNQIIPIEVKSGTTGCLRSLQEFIKQHKPAYALRFSAQNYSLHGYLQQGYLHNYPLYAIAKAIGSPFLVQD